MRRVSGGTETGRPWKLGYGVCLPCFARGEARPPGLEMQAEGRLSEAGLAALAEDEGDAEGGA